MKTLLGKDCKSAYKEFSDFFNFFERLKKYGLAATEHGARLLPMDVWSPQDLSSIWKSLNTGSGARRNGNNHFCHLCPCIFLSPDVLHARKRTRKDATIGA